MLKIDLTPKLSLLKLIFLDMFGKILNGFFNFEIIDISASLLFKKYSVSSCSDEVSFNQNNSVDAYIEPRDNLLV